MTDKALGIGLLNSITQGSTISDLDLRSAELLASIELLPVCLRILRILERLPNDAARQMMLRVGAETEVAVPIAEGMEGRLRAKWGNEALVSSPVFEDSDEQKVRDVKRFEEADGKLMESSRAAVLNAITGTRPSFSVTAPRESQLGILRAQINARRRRPLRWTFSHCPEPILALKPCIAASPLAVAQYLSASQYEFDTVIFDEASQVRAEDAVVSIAKGKQVIVIGDSQQMPPTSFFDAGLADDDDDEELTHDFESILDDAEALLPSKRLLWHYRSQDEKLIAFSNKEFYTGELMTFPSSWTDNPELGVVFEYLPDAIYGRGGEANNPEEAERVVELLSSELERHPTQEVAITAMSVRQQNAIINRVEKRADQNPRLAEWLEAGGRIKNLETVQGDESDVMILSFGYGKDSSGRLTFNFGPLSREDGYRRLNVAITRARRKCIVVASLKSSDIPSASVGPGGQIVKRYLEYAERGPSALYDSVSASGVDVFDSDLEQEVATRLRSLGWVLDTQVGVGNYRIDLGIRDPNQPGRYLMGVECDGASFHSSKWARDRDLVRARVLRDRGWTLERVWSTSWFRNPEAIVSRLSRRYEELLNSRNVDTDEVSGDSAARPSSQVPEFMPNAGGLPNGAVFYEPPTPNSKSHLGLERAVVTIARERSPIHEEELIEIVREEVSHIFSGRSGNSLIRSAIHAATSSGELKILRDHLWSTASYTTSRAPIVNINRRGTRTRKAKYYSDEELIAALRLTVASQGARESDLPRLTARFLGLRATESFITRLSGLRLVPSPSDEGSPSKSV